MTEKKFIIIVVVISFMLLFGGIMIMNSSTSSQQVKLSSEAKAYTKEPTSFDWGIINYNGNKATKTFTIKNTGKDVLKIYNVKTSCHCTKAHVTIDGIESPDFGMSGVSSWVGTVKPGSQAKLIVVFDQTYHGPQGVGPITRFVSVETNDRGTSKLTFTLTGTVVK